MSSRRFSAVSDVAYTASSGSQSQHLSNIGAEADQTLPPVQQLKPSEWKERIIDAQQEPISPRFVSRCRMVALVYVPFGGPCFR